MELKTDMIDMSLDEYIAMSNNSLCSANKNNNGGFVGNDAKFGRRRGNIDDEEEDDEEMLLKSDEYEDMLLKSDEDEATEEVDTGIWKGPDSSVVYIDCHDQQNDLRKKLNANKKVDEVSSVQYRLMAPNNSADRPRGIPTLLPLDAYVSNTGGYNRRQRRRRRNRGFNNSFNNHNANFNHNNRINNHNNNNHINKDNNNHINNNRNNVGGVNNGRIQRNRSQDLRNISRLSYNSNGNFKEFIVAPSQGNSKNLVIEQSSFNLKPSCYLKPSLQVPQSVPNPGQQRNRNMPIGNLTPQAQAALNLNSNPNPVPNPSTDNLKSLLGFQGNVSGEMMPVFASRLLEFLQNGAQAQVHKPMYDMKLQKDIHEIQNKPLLYKCNGGEVISSDGAGVNCEIIPRTSGVSLNCRFA